MSDYFNKASAIVQDAEARGAAVERDRLRKQVGVLRSTTGGPGFEVAVAAYDSVLALLTEPGEPRREEVAGFCQKCDGPVYHRQGRPGEYNHDCGKPRDD